MTRDLLCACCSLELSADNVGELIRRVEGTIRFLVIETALSNFNFIVIKLATKIVLLLFYTVILRNVMKAKVALFVYLLNFRA